MSPRGPAAREDRNMYEERSPREPRARRTMEAPRLPEWRHAEAWRNRTAAAPIAAALLAALTLTAPAVGAQPADAGNLKGWKIYLAARTAAGAGPNAPAIRDYTLTLTTTAATPQGKAEFHSRFYFKYPRLIRQEIESQAGQVVIVSDGDRGWRLMPDDIQYLPASDVKRIWEDLERVHIFFAAAPEPAAVHFIGGDTVEGRKVDVIEISDVAGAPLKLFVDAETHDVLKKAYTGDTPIGRADVEEFYSDYKNYGVYRWWGHKRVLRNGREALAITVDDVKINTGLSEADLKR